jgi:hypothetical protein
MHREKGYDVSIDTTQHNDIETIVKISEIIDAIRHLPWHELESDEVLCVAHAYYYFSIQFRENLEIARSVWPDDLGLARLYEEECNTDNLSPWPGVADAGEKLNHDEFMRRLLALQPMDEADRLDAAGIAYLTSVRRMDDITRAQSIISYEDGGLSEVFQAILQAPCWDGAAAQAFKFFLQQHILFDENENAGHGAMVRHIRADCDVTPLWTAFYEILADSVPRLLRQTVGEQRDEVKPPPLNVSDNIGQRSLTAAAAAI